MRIAERDIRKEARLLAFVLLFVASDFISMTSSQQEERLDFKRPFSTFEQMDRCHSELNKTSQTPCSGQGESLTSITRQRG